MPHCTAESTHQIMHLTCTVSLVMQLVSTADVAGVWSELSAHAVPLQGNKLLKSPSSLPASPSITFTPYLRRCLQSMKAKFAWNKMPNNTMLFHDLFCFLQMFLFPFHLPCMRSSTCAHVDWRWIQTMGSRPKDHARDAKSDLAFALHHKTLVTAIILFLPRLARLACCHAHMRCIWTSSWPSTHGMRCPIRPCINIFKQGLISGYTSLANSPAHLTCTHVDRYGYRLWAQGQVRMERDAEDEC